MGKSLRPSINHEDFLIEELDDELLVYDEQRQLACRLNQTAAVVWRHCDGDHAVPQLVEVLREEVGEVADEDLVMITLDQLQEQGLLESGFQQRQVSEARLSRRRFIRRVGVVGTAAMALPVVQSLVAPSHAAAQSNTCSCGCTCPCVFCDSSRRAPVH